MFSYDLSPHFNEEFETGLLSKKWDERKATIDNLISTLDKHPAFISNEAYHRLIGEISKVRKPQQ
jgi:hypothetical protein